MKTTNISSLFLIAPFLIFTGCKKENTSNPDIETTFRLSEDQAIGESAADDANIVFFEAAISQGLTGARTSQVLQTTNSLSCATLTVTPQNSFPKTLTIDFVNGCTSIDGVVRKGKINIVLSDSLFHSGTTAVLTFDNYHVSGFKVEGTITWANTSSVNGFSWTREITNGKITTPGGNYYWLHAGMKNVQQTAGASTHLNLLDDVYSVTGNHTVTNPVGNSRTATITEALEKKIICHSISKGKIKIEGPNHFAILDYGDGTCDKLASISIDGHPPRTISLP